MVEGLQENQLKGALEALLFVTDDAVSTLVLSQMLEVEPAEVERALVELRDEFEQQNRGIQLREVAGGWRLFTHPAYHELIEKYVLSWDTRKLSQAALEKLAIVAYLQPVTRAQVASVRGVNSDSAITSLVEKGLLREAGTADTAGNPTLYATTRVFLEKFGLRSVADLPDLDQFAPDDQTREFIRERLSATREEAVVSEEILLDEDVDGLSEGIEIRSDETKEPSDPFDGVVIDYDQDAPDPAQQLLAQAVASGFGLVEKINFDELTFETDDE